MEATQDLIGKLIQESTKRDAIHIAVFPVVAALTLQPGARVGLDEEGKANNMTGNDIGIIDPFLTKPVRRGERCFMFMLPNTITGLRHEWTHPALDAAEAERQSARETLMEYGSRESLSFEEVLSGLNYGYENGGEVCFPSDINYSIKEEEAPDVWRAYCLYTGKPMPSSQTISATRFRCAC